MPPRDGSDGRGRWKASKSTRPSANRKQAKKWTAIGILGTLLGGAAMVAIYLLLLFGGWFQPKTRYVPFWVGRHALKSIAPISWIDSDRRAIREGNRFREFDESDFDDPDIEVMNLGLSALGKQKPGDSIVVHFSGYAVVSGVEAEKHGPIRILAKASNPNEPGTMLPLRTVLEQFAACPARKKLLILDLTKSRLDLSDLGGMGTSDGVSDLIRAEVDRPIGGSGEADPRNPGLILLACSEGETSVEIDSFEGSLFNHHLQIGLEDPAADANGDGQIKVKELAAYLGKLVHRDALHYRGLRQTPELLGRGQDFALVSVGSRRVIRAKPAPEPVAKDKAEAPPEKEKEKAKEDEKAQDKEKGENKEKAQDKEKEKEKPAGKEESREEADPRAYPSWLMAEWSARDALWSSGDYADSPRPFRALEAQLIRADRRWRGGDDPAKIRSETKRACDQIKEKLKEVREATWLTPKSVGQARALGWKPEDALIAELKAVFRRRREPDAFSKPEQQAEALTAAVKAFLAKLKGKTMLDLAGAMVDVLSAADERFDAKTIQFADSIVDQAIKADTSLQRDLIELRFLGLLALRSNLPGLEPWSEETAKHAWEVVVIAEQADCQPRSLAWLSGLLDQADSLRHEVEILTLPQTAGYASWKQIDNDWARARAAYDFIVSSQRKIDAAQATLAQARAVLPAEIPFLETIYQPELEKLWHEAALKAQALGDLLVPPSDMPTRDAVGLLNDDLVETTESLNDLLKSLQEPFSERALRGLIEDCRSEQERPDPSLAVRIEAILTTPFVKAQQRQALWEAGRDLDRRLAKVPPSDQPDSTNPSTRARQLQKDRMDRATARANRLAGLLHLAGDRETAQEMDAALKRALATVAGQREDTRSGQFSDSISMLWTLMAGRCANVRRDLKKLLQERGPGEERASWVAPVDDLRWPEHLVQESKGARQRALLAWLSSRYRHEKEDARTPEIGSFYRQAELKFLSNSEPVAELYPELSSDAVSASSPVRLSADRNRQQLSVQVNLRTLAESDPKKVMLRVLEPADDRLRVNLVGGPTLNLELKPQNAQSVNVQVEWSESGIRPPGPAPAPSGFILQARLGENRSYHLPIPLAIVPSSEQLQLALSPDPAQCLEIPFELRLRAIAEGGVPVRQKFYLYVKNPSTTPRKVVVEILKGDAVVATAGSTEKPMALPPSSTMKVPAFGAAPIPPTEALQPLPDPAQLQFRLKDASSGEVYQLQKMTVDLASPRDFLEVVGARFTPRQPGEDNRLELRFRARPNMTLPASLLMALEKRLIPALDGIPKEMKLEGTLDPAAEETLYAAGLALNPLEKTEGLVPVDVDGLKRAFWFRTRFEQSGSRQGAELISKPRIYFEANQVIRPKESAKLKVAFQVDDAPPGSRLRWQIGQVIDGRVVDDITPFERPRAKDRRIAFDARGAEGALLFEASSKDWEPELSVANIRGKRRLRAGLLDSDGRTELADYTIDKILDDQPPAEIALKLPKEAKPKGIVEAAATVTSPASGLKEVVFYYGKGNADDFKKAQDEKRLFKGIQKGSEPRATWEAKLVIPETATGPVVVSVRALSNVDLAGFATDEVGIILPKPAPDPAEEEAKKAAMPKVGEIAGKLTEGDRPQPDLTIYTALKAPKAGSEPKLLSTKSAKDGTYSFKDLEPGIYVLQSTNPASMTIARGEVTVEAGKTATVNLDLIR